MVGQGGEQQRGATLRVARFQGCARPQCGGDPVRVARNVRERLRV